GLPRPDSLATRSRVGHPSASPPPRTNFRPPGGVPRCCAPFTLPERIPMRLVAFSSSLALATLLALPSLARAQDPVDVATIERIKTEAIERSQVMDIMSWLTDVHGPRLTGSPITMAAGEWASESLRKWGVENVHYDW